MFGKIKLGEHSKPLRKRKSSENGMMSEVKRVELIKGEFKNLPWGNYGEKYSLIIKAREFESNKEYQFDVSDCRDVNDVCGINFLYCHMPAIPLNFPWHQFPNVEFLDIKSSELATVSMEDFNGMNKAILKRIWLDRNCFEYLPGDLFSDMINLEDVSFYECKIKYIEPEIAGQLEKLKKLDFRRIFSSKNKYDIGESKEKLVKIIEDELKNCPVTDNLRKKMNHKFAIKQLQQEILIVKKKSKEDNSAAVDMKNALKNEDFKDFTITVNDREFKVHKFLLVARSPVLAEMIQNNPDASALKLEHIPTEIFERVLDFLYNDTLPQDGATFKDIFIAAGRLKIEKLKNFAGDKLIDQVNEKNAFEVLLLANKYNHNGLRVAAFDEVKKMFPDKNLKNKLAENAEKIQKLYELKLKRESFVKQFEEEFNSSNFDDCE